MATRSATTAIARAAMAARRPASASRCRRPRAPPRSRGSLERDPRSRFGWLLLAPCRSRDLMIADEHDQAPRRADHVHHGPRVPVAITPADQLAAGLRRQGAPGLRQRLGDSSDLGEDLTPD